MLPIMLTSSIDSYIKSVYKIPMLTLEEETNLAKDFKENNNVEAAKKMILSHLRLVVSITREYLNFGFQHADLIQEGNIGLMKAVKHFDYKRGVRLVSFAIHWIKAEIHEYILKNWRIVKIATTKAQRKLFFNLNKLKNKLQILSSVSDSEAILIAKELDGVKPSDVIEMDRRFNNKEIDIDNTFDIAAENITENTSYDVEVLKNSLDKLDDRSKNILSNRWLSENPMTLQELSEKLKISAERVRQIEKAAFKKIKKYMGFDIEDIKSKEKK